MGASLTILVYVMFETAKDAKMPIENLYNSNNIASSLRNIRFAIVYNYWEQQTNAILNMWSLQKWANFMGFKVLEPFAYQSTLALTDQILYHYNFTNVLRFRDYFDLDFGPRKQRRSIEFHHLRIGIHLLFPH